MRILVIKPRQKTIPLGKDFIIHAAEDIAEGLSMAQHEDYDIILLDEGAGGGKTAAGAVHYLRSRISKTPLVVLASTDSESAEIAVLNAGAADYIVMPAGRERLQARIKAVLRREQGRASEIIKIGRVSIDLTQKSVYWDESKIMLTRYEFRTFALLATAKKPLNTEEIINQLYNLDSPESNAIQTIIGHIRKKLRTASKGEAVDYLLTRHGIGYSLKNPNAEAENITEELHSTARYESCEVIILNEGADGKTAASAVRDQRSRGVMTPILVVASIVSEDAEAAALNAGADDYIVGSVSEERLQARMSAVRRREQRQASEIIKIGRVSIDLTQKQAYWDQNKISLTPHEFKVLALLATTKKPLNAQEITNQHYNLDSDFPNSNVIQKLISNIREKLHEASNGETDKYFLPKYSRAYSLKDPDAGVFAKPQTRRSASAISI